MQEIIQIGVIKVVNTIKSIDIPSTPNLNLIKLFIQTFLQQTEILKCLNQESTTEIERGKK